MSPQPTSPTASVRSPEPTHDTEQQQEQSSTPEPSHPPFDPLFILLSNTTNNATSHPRVHYIFTDDEPTILPPSNSILIDLESTPANPPTSSTTSSSADKDKEKTSSWSIKTASSLSPNFAVTSANLSGEGILKIEGVGREAVSSSRAQLSKSNEARSTERESLHGIKEGEDAEGLVDEFRRRMGVLRRVVEQGEKSISPLVQRDGDKGDSAEEDEDKDGQGKDKVEGS